MRKAILALFVTMFFVLAFDRLPVSAANIVENKTEADITWTFYDNGLLDLRQAYNKNTGKTLTFGKYKSRVKSVVIQPGVEKIPYDTFTGYTNLKSVRMSNSVHEIGDFSGCTSLKSITFPDSVNKMGNFTGCTSLKSVTLSKSLLKIGNFTNCKSLTSITIPLSAHKIGDFSGCSSLTGITIPNSVEKMGNFTGCTSLKKVTMSNSIVKMGDFSGCTSLTSINIPLSVHEVGSFSGCTSLKTISIPLSVSKITDFSGCTRLKNVTLPKSIIDEIIADGTIFNKFLDTPWLNSRYDKNTIIEAIRKTDPGYAIVRKKGTTLKDAATGNRYTVISDNSSSPTVSFKGTTSKASTITIPDSFRVSGITYKVTEVSAKALKNNKKVKTVKLGKNISKICSEAFYGCTYLTDLTLPAKTSKLENNFAGNCKNLKTLTVKSTAMTKNTLSDNAFSKIGTAVKVQVPKGKVKSYTTLFRGKGLAKKVKVQTTGK